MKHLIWAAAFAALPLLAGSLRAENPQQADASLAKLATPAPSDLLISRNSMESLTTVATVSLDSGRSIQLEPGVRVTRDDDGYLFAARGVKKIEIATDTDRYTLLSPARAQLTPEGWVINGKPLGARSITARWAVQDDTDSNLKSMQEAAKKLKAKNDAAPATKKKLQVRWLYGENPFPTSELFNTQGIQQLIHLLGTPAAAASAASRGISPVGF
jgi:hypothetical protein